MAAALKKNMELDEPTDLGRYRLCSELASGGMATVFLATIGAGTPFTKLVAIKRIHSHLANDRRFVDMFLDEAHVASQISHPNVCSVFDFGEIDGTYFLAMEYLEGETFGAITKAMKQRPRTLDDFLHIAEIIAQAAEGLHSAHELKGEDGEALNIVHRDVSPQNLLLSYDGCVKVMDFGIARCEGKIQQTEPGTIKGKLSFIAPEQVRNTGVDRRADLWSLGVTMWEMLTGKSLFRRANDLQTLQAVIGEPVLPPSALVPEIPPELDEIVLKALERNPERRWQTALEMRRALRAWVHSAGASIGQVELAEWGKQLFPEELRREAKQARVRARRNSGSQLRRAERTPSEEIVATPIPTRSKYEPPHEMASVERPLTIDVDDPEEDDGPEEQAPSAAPFWIGMAVATFLALAGGGWVMALGGLDGLMGASSQTAVPTVASPPPPGVAAH